jgi:hypothetical protein
MAINRSQLRKHLEPGLNGLFGQEYGQYPDEGRDVYEMESSDRAFEEEVMTTGFGNAYEKNEGDSVRFDTAQETYTARWDHKTYALAFEITEEAIEDNLYGQLSRRYTKALARSMSHTKNIESARLFNFAFTAGENAIGDGQAMCSTSHSTLDGGDQSNRFSVGADLNETSLEEAVIAIQDFRDERGLKVAAKPICPIVPNELQFVVHRIMKSVLRSGTSDNDANALRDMQSFAREPKVMHFLTDPDAWFIKTDVPNGLKRMNRVSLSTKMDEDFSTGNLRYKVRERYSHNIGDWRGIFGSPGAA